MPRILLIEDNADNRAAMSLCLRRSGFHVITALNGQLGLEAVHAEHPDLVLMDLNLPVLDGWQAARMLREDPRTQALPIIGLTAHAMPGDREKALEAGCTDYHPKPVDFPRLLEQIESYLEAPEGSPPTVGEEVAEVEDP